MALAMTMTMTWAMTTDLDVTEGLPEVALMDLDHLARTTRGQTHVLTVPPQPGFHLALLEEDRDARTTRGLSVPMAPDPTTASVKTQANQPAQMELPHYALTVASQLQDQSVQTTLMWSFSELRGEPLIKEPLEINILLTGELENCNVTLLRLVPF